MKLDPEEQHLQEKIKHSKRLHDKNRFDHVKRTERIRRIFARIRDHVKSYVGR
jgi:hypothetical protein